MYIMNDPVTNLERLVEAIESAGANIAPSYLEYMPLSFAIANDCGEAGRALFHRICRLSEKYQSKDADKLFSAALEKSNGKSTLGTVWHLADMAGVNVKDLSCMTPPPPTHTREAVSAAPVPLAPPAGKNTPGPRPSQGFPLPPPFPEYRWPRLLQQAIDCGASRAQRDILLLGAITVAGATLNKLVCFNYSHKDYYPCLQTFVVAPPASGKGVLAWTRQLAGPIHDELFTSYLRKMTDYRTEKTRWDCMGKEKSKYPEPEQPRMKLFFIAGDNSGTGMQENLMDSEGTGLICESEADTVSTAIGADYGHWSHTLRKAFDHDPLSYNRRANHEYRECNQLLLSVLLSGTPAQLGPLIPSPENGLFSRQLFYYMPPISEWTNQFDLTGENYGQLFRRWGEQWKTTLNAVKAETSCFRLRLSSGQQDTFNQCMAQIFSHAGTSRGNHMRSTVARIAINTCRILCVVAVLRSLEEVIGENGSRSLTERMRACLHLTPGSRTPRENIADGMTPSFILTVSEEDFEAVMGLVEPLYRHACYVLSFLPDASTVKRQPSSQEIFLTSLPLRFTRREVMETARTNGISENTFDSLLKRLTEKGIIENTGKGDYQFASRVCVGGEEPCKKGAPGHNEI